MGLPVSHILLATGFVLVLIGFWGLLRHRNILRIIIGFSLVDTGMHIVMVATGYITGGTAPIIDEALGQSGGGHARRRSHPVGARRDRDRHRVLGQRRDAGLCHPAP